jgi:putative phosphoribosyl transferase
LLNLLANPAASYGECARLHVQIPGNTEAGFGAVSTGDEYVVDQQMADALGLTPDEVDAQKQKAIQSVQTRLRQYGDWAKIPVLTEKPVVLVDDGLATGGTMEAGIRIVRRHDPAKVIVAVPTGSERAVNRLYPLADQLVCPHVGHGSVFAVANAYQDWYDVTDQEVMELLADSG